MNGMLELFEKLLINLKVIDVAFALMSSPGGSGGFTLSNPLDPCKDLSCIALAIIKALFLISIPIVSIMVLVGGFQILTAGGDPEKFKTGRKTIIYAVVGFAIILIAGGVVSIIQSLINP